MFEKFDPKLFDDPNFKEDSVREEIIVPILKRLGYTASGTNQIVRSKALLHPFVMIGSKKHPIKIIPDYLLYSEGRPAWILDAKGPNTQLVKSKHAEQAYSYAIHPDVRVRFYALCNGRKLVIYDIYAISPILELDYLNIERDWGIINSILGPQNVAVAPERYFAPDFGIAVMKMGAQKGERYLFPFSKLTEFAQVDQSLFTMATGVPIGGVNHLVSFDAEESMFLKLLECTDKENRDYLLSKLDSGQLVYPLRPIFVSLDTLIGEPTRGQHDYFVPLNISGVKPLAEKVYQEAEKMFEDNEEPDS